MKIGLFPHLGKKKAVSMAREIAEWLGIHGVGVLLEPEAARALDLPELASALPEPADGEPSGGPATTVDVAVSLGGDGALLHTARALVGTGVPILGINLGHLGFLTEVGAEGAYDALERLLRNDYHIEERMMIEARAIRGGEEVARFVGLNDAVITKGAFARMIRLATYVEGNHIGTYPADGVIFATPTGSTAYSLSAGGPIVNPQVESFIITYICPHTLFARSFVISHTESSRVVVIAPSEEIMLTVDGQVGYPLMDGDEVMIRKSDYKTRLVKLAGRNFYELLRSRFSGLDRIPE